MSSIPSRLLRFLSARVLTVLVLLGLLASLAAVYFRSSYSNTYFRPPLDISLQLAANFGELREDHFHMGLDIRTMGREDLPVYAAADGYISHIKIEEIGLGKALFITHPNGRTTVYGHLDKFVDNLSAFIERRQYATENWAQEVDLRPDQFPVRKGQFIAYSGNTGSSQAPHLHFEVRDTNTGRSINPLLAGLAIPDEQPPLIKGLYWYDRRYSTYWSRARKIVILSKNGLYRTAEPVIKFNSPLVSLGLSAVDKASNSPHLSGIFQAELWLDDSLIHSFHLRELSDTDTRYVNACIDYLKWKRSGIYVQHLSVLPGNHLPIFAPVGRDGLIRLKDTLVHVVHIRVGDVYHNYSDLDLRIQLASSGQTGDAAIRTETFDRIPGYPIPRNVRMLYPGRENRVNGRDIQARFSAAAFYDEVPFLLTEQANTGNNKASALIHLHDSTVPVHDRFSVQVRTTLAPGDPLRDKTVLQMVSGDSQSIVKGSWQGDWMVAFLRQLGELQLLIDTIGPTVEASGWTEGQTFGSDVSVLNLLCKDDLGFVARFRAELDGHWILFEQKGAAFRYAFDGHCPNGEHTLLVTVTDVAGNETRRLFSFIRQ